MKKLSLFVLSFVCASVSFATIRTERITYKHGGTDLRGYLAYDDAITGKRPGVVVVHEWWGHNEYVQKRAEQLASLGYVAFALDMYGTGVVTTDFKRAAELSSIYKNDRQLMRGRAFAGLKVLKKHPLVDDKHIGAIGYCFGGTVVLEMARAGMDLDGVVSFHGGLDTPDPSDARKIKGKVLVLTGADDNYVPASQIASFEEEMKQGNVDWQLNIYSHSVHGFTNAANGTDNSKGLAYNAEADARSWEAMKSFFNEVFK